MLKVEALESAYGDSRILFGIDFFVGAGEVVTLLGRNGMGKTTTVKSIFGLLKPRGGRVTIDGEDYLIMREDDILGVVVLTP